MTTPNNQDDELDEILRDFDDGSVAEEAWVDAKAAILAWNNQQLEREVIEAEIKIWKAIARSVDTCSYNTQKLLRYLLPDFDANIERLSKSKEEK